MGCASSNPLVEGGKNIMESAKDATENAMTKGGKAIHDAGDVITDGMDHMKGAVESGLSTAQNSIGSVVTTIENSFHTTTSTAEEAVNEIGNEAEDMANKTTAAMEEAISDTKTVLAFEDATNAAEHLKDEFGEAVEKVEKAAEEALHVEDFDGQAVDVDAPQEEEKAEVYEPPLTPWEAEADKILERSLSMKSSTGEHFNFEEIQDKESDITNPEPGVSTKDDILLSDTLSVKSYKSEI